MRTAFFADTFNQFVSFDDKRKAVGWNTGNILFLNAIYSMLDCDLLPYGSIDGLDAYDSFVTAELIWLQENVEPWPELVRLVDAAKDRPVVPISVGLQAASYRPDFTLNPNMVWLLKDISSRCVIGVRGEYTAEVLHRHGIDNLEVVGCPSLYQIPLFRNDLKSLFSKPYHGRAVANYKTIESSPDEIDDRLLRYIAHNCRGFVEQFSTVYEDFISDEAICAWFTENSHMFFDLEAWVRHVQRYDFSFGLRFHGNVAAMLGGTRALFLTLDSRTTEMTRHFKLPSLEREAFDIAAPMDEQFARADFSAFARDYRSHFRNFDSFVRKNGLQFTRRFEDRVARFDWGIEADGTARLAAHSRVDKVVATDAASSDLIFDIGMNNGDDAEFYLAKGFRVVAVEANPALVTAASKKLAGYIETGRLVILGVGLTEKHGCRIFYVNQNIDAWSSFDPMIASRGHPIIPMVVETMTVAALIAAHGVPYYAKVDIEGLDSMAVTGLISGTAKPHYISYENPNPDLFERLVAAGYRRFKAVAQSKVPEYRCPVPAREGKTVDFTFPAGASGPFGDDTPGEWLGIEDMRVRVTRLELERMEALKRTLYPEWYDMHAGL